MKFAISASLAFCMLGSFAVGQAMDPLGSGRPSSYTVSELPNDLVALDLVTSKDNLQSLFMMSYSSMGSIIPGGEQEAKPWLNPETLFQLANVVWVLKSEAMEKSEFLIGYRLDIPMSPRTQIMEPSKVRFRITYVKRDSILAMTPREEFAPAKIKEASQTNPQPTGTQADRTATLSNLKQAGTALMIFLADYDDIFPYVQSSPQLFKFLEPYARNAEIFKTKNPMGGAFRFNMSLAGVNSTDVEKPAEVPMIYESEAWADGKRCVCYADSHAKVVSAEEWQKLQPMLNLKLKRQGKPIPPNATVPPDHAAQVK
jgi:hypothetical protein